jgi:hypothetical protein
VANDLQDYFGIPRVTGIPISALPIRGFNLIYNNFYRDQDLCPERTLEDTTVPFVAWEKDYFTSARPWPQKGEEVSIPLVGEAPVLGIGLASNFDSTGYNASKTRYQADGSSLTQTGVHTNNEGSGDAVAATINTHQVGGRWVPDTFADLTGATGASVDDVRRAFAIQRFQEARSRYGSRYTEYLRYIGVTPRDGRGDLPEYLGGGNVKISVSEVLQTAPDEATEVDYGVGDMFGHGVGAMKSNAYRRYFEEHGYVISLLSVRPKALYQDGIPRHWLKQDKEDFWQRELQFIGQQPVKLNEVYASVANGGNVFGYADRYREYREMPSQVSAEFRNVLSYWHLGRQFSGEPALNQAFVECNPSKRIFNEQVNHCCWTLVQHKLMARRLVSSSTASRVI